MFDEHILLDPVLAALEADRSFPDDEQDSAMRLARMRGNPTVRDLKGRARSLVHPDRPDQETGVELGLRLARASVSVDPNEFNASDTLAWALFFNGKYEEAVAESERALGLAPEGAKEKFQGILDRMRGMIEVARSEEDG